MRRDEMFLENYFFHMKKVLPLLHPKSDDGENLEEKVSSMFDVCKKREARKDSFSCKRNT